MDKLSPYSHDNIKENIEALKALFPDAVSEGKIDFEMLAALLGEDVDSGLEKYAFTWKGKLESLKLAQKRSVGTLRPCRVESRDWDTTGNLYIEGDNLEVLKLLQQGYLRKVKMIYIDPPYNTGNDFVYEDDFADPVGRYKEVTGQGMRANPETAGRYHSNWLNMMYPRLKIAKTLLRDDGAIFISIDDSEQANMKKLCDEVFGEDNFVANIVWQKKQSPQNDAVNFSDMHDYILVYARKLKTNREDKEGWQRNLLPRDENDSRYANPDNDPRGSWASGDLTCNKSAQERPNLYYPIVNPNTNEEVWPNTQRVWICEKTTMQRLMDESRLWWGESGRNVPRQKKYLTEVQDGIVPSTWWDRVFASDNQTARRELRSLFSEQDGDFSYPKPTLLIKKMLQIATTPNDLVLDFFSGSGTTAHAVMQLNAEDGGNRKCICVQIPELTDENSDAYKAGYRTIADIGKERIRRAGDKIREGAGLLADKLDIGFRVFKLDTSNIKEWDADWTLGINDYTLLDQRIESMLSPVKPDRTDEDLICEVFLKYGVPLTEKVAPLDIQGKTFYVVGENGYLFICLESGIMTEMVEKVAQYAPGTMFFSRESFANSNDVTNAALVLDKRKIEMRWL